MYGHIGCNLNGLKRQHTALKQELENSQDQQVTQVVRIYFRRHSHDRSSAGSFPIALQNAMSIRHDTTRSQPNRRNFVRAGYRVGTAALATLAGTRLVRAEPSKAFYDSQIAISPGDTILFQGDSITDAGRQYSESKANEPAALGGGYAWLAAAQVIVDSPDSHLKVFNRGINGNKVYQLAERWQTDCIALKPDVLSILIGVNDVWHKFEGRYDGTLNKYETDYRNLLRDTRKLLPKVKLVVCEPFLLKVDRVDDSLFPTLAEYRAAARRVAKEAGAAFVAFQTMFDRALKIAPAAQWVPDGVHPNTEGAALMAHWWLKAVGAK
jgi:lysophospholipase L1-like esterase